MNLFEKIFNHQIMSRLEDSGTVAVTSHERAWLKTMLTHPAADEAFTAGTLNKLQAILETEQAMDISPHLIEKARSKEQQVYHPLLGPLRRHILHQTGIRITYQLKDERLHTDHPGLPYKLEYSMVKREWYLLWYRMRHPALMSTKLQKIHTITPETFGDAAVERMQREIAAAITSRQDDVRIEVVPIYNSELSRILYAFSSFEKTVEYDMASDTYSVRVALLGDEMEYLLSKLRFLGRRVRVVSDGYLKKRMLESSTKALARYGDLQDEEELTS